MKAFILPAVLLVGLAAAGSNVCAQSRYGYGALDTDGYYRNQSRGYGISPDQNSRYGYGTGRFGFGASRFGETNATRYGAQYSPFGGQLSNYGNQYNAQGFPVPKDWTPENPAYNPAALAPVLPPSTSEKPAASAAPLPPLVLPKAPTTRPASQLPRPNVLPAPTSQPSPG